MTISIEQDALISDIFFHLAPLLRGHHEQYARESISYLAGKYSVALNECGIKIKPAKIRQDFFNRL
jgi:hypothetical protein